ncbi:MAG TPA: type VII secretion protein EccC, partial [Mycobacterium sp.]
MAVGTQGFVRRTRIAAPRMPGGEVNLQAPPEVPRVIPANLVIRLMPVVMVVAVVGMIALMVSVGGRSMASNPMMMMFPMMMVMSMAGMLVGGGGRSGKAAAELNEERKDYFRYLADLRDDAERTGDDQRAALEWSHPDPGVLVDVVGTRRMWERRPADGDFCHVRVGVGTHRLATRLLAPETGPPEDLEPVSTVALRRFVHTHSVAHAMPTAVSLRAFPSIDFAGDAALIRQLVRAILLELAVFHGPEHLQIAVVTRHPDAPEWAWVKWLPHAQHPSVVDGVGNMRMMYSSLRDLEVDLAAELGGRGGYTRGLSVSQGVPHLVVVLDDGYIAGDERLATESGVENTTLLDLDASAERLAAKGGLHLVVTDGAIAARTAVGNERFATPDALSITEAEAAARRI